MALRIKQLLMIVLVTVMATAGETKAQRSEPSVIALVNKASWCHICEENSARFEREILPAIKKNKSVQLVVNNVTDKKTKDLSRPKLEQAGLIEIAKKYKATGVIYFLDAKSKRLLSKISLASTSNDITTAYQKVLTTR